MLPNVVAQHQGKRCPVFRALFWNNALGRGCVFLSESVLEYIFSIVRFIQHWGLSLMLQFVVLSKGKRCPFCTIGLGVQGRCCNLIAHQ